MSEISILSQEEKRAYEYPPRMTPEEREMCFKLTPELHKKLKQLRTHTNQVAFLLQYGYFKQSQRFFPAHRFLKADIEYVAKQLKISTDTIDLSHYKNKRPIIHQMDICALQSYRPFDKKQTAWVKQETKRRVEQLTDPRQLFFELLQLLYEQKIELPSYHCLSDIISQYYHAYELRLISLVKASINKKMEASLAELLKAEKPRSPGLLRQLKVLNQSKKPKGIASSINTFQKVSDLFTALQPVIKVLQLTPQSTQYYSTWVKKSKLSQLKQCPNRYKTYLHLIAFLQDQYYSRQDAFVDILLKSVQTAKNTAKIRLKENDYVTRSDRKAAVKYVTKKNKNYRKLVDEIREITESPLFTASGKVDKIAVLLEEDKNQDAAVDPKTREGYEKSLDLFFNDKDYFEILGKLSIKLQNKVSSMVSILKFNNATSDEKLMDAIAHYSQCQGNSSSSSPNAFLSEKERAALFDEQRKFNISLYKILLFIHIADGIKSGRLNLQSSYRYLSINEYLVDNDRWLKQRDVLLNITGLSKFEDTEHVLNALKAILNDKYDRVNTRLKKGSNPYLSVRDNGFVKVLTPALPEKESESITTLLSQKNYISIEKILSKINEVTNFEACFKHHNIKNNRARPKTDIFSAGIIGLGCNIGTNKMSHISSGINQHTLNNTVHWYFSLKNITSANNVLLSFFDKLSLTRVFMGAKNERHSASDGRKVVVTVPSLIANRSFKYFGQRSGVSVYTFIDERQALFYSTVISASEREAAYVIDGLNNNDVIKTDIHSTDTYGYTESIFTTAYFMSTSYAPRIKNINKQRIYSFTSPQTYKDKGYPILPTRAIHKKLIKDYWEDILRFMATIKLKEVSASQLFKRLSSYAKDHPLYKAIKEFGRILKSIFILTYYDDVTLRQRIEKQLSRIETSNRFGRAVFYGNSGEFKQALPEEQQVIAACTVLIQNAIVLWNYLYFSQLLTDCDEDEDREGIIKMIREGSMMHWMHVNLHGEFNFLRSAANEVNFNIRKILKLKVV